MVEQAGKHPTLSLRSDAVMDVAGNSANTVASAVIGLGDSTPPALTRCTHIDSNANGKVDGIRVYLTKAIISSSAQNFGRFSVIGSLAGKGACAIIECCSDLVDNVVVNWHRVFIRDH